ncbi:hypothetical protein QQS21_006033 [Conoideocrella luteorostrata]|uniref:Rhodopsin domain-containing protein n=1 Tax=Conoideocrella luteorostrata TaxID=1105319 RepID=A0AAJ0CSI9_9HYPO|nr:hypothetical protein QQS21_006033 [Conoideocrella luteorostrata]
MTKTVCQAPVRDQTTRFNVMVLTFGIIAGATVVIRLKFKEFFSVKRRLESDDWIIFTALPVGLACIILEVTGLTAHGLGRDMWGISRDNLIAFGRYFYTIQSLYVLLMTQIKLTFCFFYLNIFSGRIIRRFLWGTVIFHILFSLAFFIGVLCACIPVEYHWNKFDWTNGPTAEGRCLNINSGGWANGAVSVASDFWLLGIPLCGIRKLKLHWKKKVGVALMFLTGAGVTIVSILRLTSIPHYAKTTNPTWDQYDVIWWSTVENTTPNGGEGRSRAPSLLWSYNALDMHRQKRTR